MTSQTPKEVTWFGERSAGPRDDDPTDKDVINSDDEERDQESEEEIHEDDLYVDYNLDNLDALVINKDGEKHEEEESWEECDTQTTTVTDNDQIRTSRWGGDWNEEDEEQIRKINHYAMGSQCTAGPRVPPQQVGEEQTKEVAATRSILQDHVYDRPPIELRLLTLGNSCTRCGREHDGSCAIGAAILSGCSSGCSQ
jgi:hypothetical protein